MAFLEVHGIGKIYVSDNNVSVGIRKVDLSFEKGEFVAVTGKSGSGKSTLLNVISGMDTYEEGEMFIEGTPTSHYVQRDWEMYRQKYISFIFQDYNIIDSFTVLQNVDLALMHITDKHARRQRALELIDKVGLSSHISHKGSKLSGGQKQRTVIARALAKDSPIILADEPTGNLDSQTSKEIIKLLRDVSHDKLVIIVTHSYDQVAEYATRHIRVFDGSIEADEIISAPKQPVGGFVKKSNPDEEKNKSFLNSFRGGITLGHIRFAATPRLSAFLCVLMVLSSLAMTLITSVSGEALGLFEKNYIFSHLPGRTVIIRQDGAVITEDELEALAEKVGAPSYMHYDFLLDTSKSMKINNDYNYYCFSFSYIKSGDNELDLDAGRAPEKASEIVLRVPISLKTYFGTKNFKETTLENVFDVVDYTVVGINYYYDNTLNPEIIFTQEGYIYASSIAYYSNSEKYFTAQVTVADNLTDDNNSSTVSIDSPQIHFSFDIGEGCYYIQSNNYDSIIKEYQNRKKQMKELFGNNDYDYSVTPKLSGSFVSYNFTKNDYYDFHTDIAYSSYGTQTQVSSDMSRYTLLHTVSKDISSMMDYNGYSLLLSPDIINDFMTDLYYPESYTQASLFFKNDLEAHNAVAYLKSLGYTAVPSDSVSENDGNEALLNTSLLFFKAVGWAAAIVFIALFISLCTARAMIATKGDIAILRSMGIPEKAINISIYVQTLSSLIPAYLITAVVCIIIFTVPVTNGIFGFLHTWQYLTIALALFAICLLLSKRYLKKMFSSSVKKSLKGRNEE